MGFGATPQLPHGRPVCQTRSTTGAGSEASLPVTSRSRRSAPNLLYQPLAYCRAKWARPTSIERSVSLAAGLFCCRGFRLCGGDQRAFRSPFGNLRAAHPCLLVCFVAGGFAIIPHQQNPPLTGHVSCQERVLLCESQFPGGVITSPAIGVRRSSERNCITDAGISSSAP